MPQFDYSSYPDPIRQDMPEAYREIWKMIAKPGNWWSGEDRVAIAAETRQAIHCELCATRKSALSPFTVKGEHASVTNLPDVAVDAVHRIVTDVSRLTEQWLLKSYDDGMTDGKYIELLGIVVAMVSIDGFHRAMGLPMESLPEPAPGGPSGYRPDGVSDMGAWVEMIPADAVAGNEGDLYDGSKQTGNVIAAMSLVPDSVRMLKTLSGTQYLRVQDVANPGTNGGRALSRAQIELLAGRVSSLSDCFY
jgi:hypothetical protein